MSDQAEAIVRGAMQALARAEKDRDRWREDAERYKAALLRLSGYDFTVLLTEAQVLVEAGEVARAALAEPPVSAARERLDAAVGVAKQAVFMLSAESGEVADTWVKCEALLGYTGAALESLVSVVEELAAKLT